MFVKIQKLLLRPRFFPKSSSIIIGIIVNIELSMYDLIEFTQPYVGAGTTSPILHMKKLRDGQGKRLGQSCD